MPSPARPITPRDVADDAPSFAIVGTGRSGTGFISNVLRSAGINCGHEEWWSPSSSRGTGGLDGDSSWLAVPALGEYRGRVVHQVRHPLDVIRSLVGIRMFSDPSHGAFRWFMYAHLPGLYGDDLTDAMRWYVGWNRRCEQHARFRYRVEDVDPALLERIAAECGHAIEPARARSALDAVSNRFNTRNRAEVDWSDLPRGELHDELLATAARYGYATP